eukprot:23718-Eustigmatos_ZCMA.PRE.1
MSPASPHTSHFETRLLRCERTGCAVAPVPLLRLSRPIAHHPHADLHNNHYVDSEGAFPLHVER